MAKVVPLDSRRATRALVKREKVVAGQPVTPLLKGAKKRRPVVRRDTATLLPFLNPRSRLVEIRGHFSDRFPGVKNIVKRAHALEYAADRLSDQDPPMIPMTEIRVRGTIRPMGRGTTPARFRSEMAKRLISARIVAGYSTKKQAAEALGITLDRYEKWESGRTPVPAQYVAPVCDLFDIDANYLFGVEPAQPARKTGTA
jgi:hypothetical protein